MNQDYKNIYLYHGTDSSFKLPDLKMSLEGKDFGKGFYLTKEKAQSRKFAKTKGLRNSKNVVYVNTYFLFNLDTLKIHIFDNVDKEWFDCVVSNRTKKASKWDKYDVLIGKIADDNTMITINAYIDGLYGKVGTDAAIKTAIALLKPEKLKDQICFKTSKAINKITFVSQEKV